MGTAFARLAHRLLQRRLPRVQDLDRPREDADLGLDVRDLRPPLLVRVALAAEGVDVALEVVAPEHGLPRKGLDEALLLVHLKFGSSKVYSSSIPSKSHLLLHGRDLSPRVVESLGRRLLLPRDDGRLLPEEGQLVHRGIAGDVALLGHVVYLGVGRLDFLLDLSSRDRKRYSQSLAHKRLDTLTSAMSFCPRAGRFVTLTRLSTTFFFDVISLGSF